MHHYKLKAVTKTHHQSVPDRIILRKYNIIGVMQLTPFLDIYIRTVYTLHSGSDYVAVMMMQ